MKFKIFTKIRFKESQLETLNKCTQKKNVSDKELISSKIQLLFISSLEKKNKTRGEICAVPVVMFSSKINKSSKIFIR